MRDLCPPNFESVLRVRHALVQELPGYLCHPLACTLSLFVVLPSACAVPRLIFRFGAPRQPNAAATRARPALSQKISLVPGWGTPTSFLRRCIGAGSMWLHPPQPSSVHSLCPRTQGTWPARYSNLVYLLTVRVIIGSVSEANIPRTSCAVLVSHMFTWCYDLPQLGLEGCRDEASHTWTP